MGSGGLGATLGTIGGGMIGGAPGAAIGGALGGMIEGSMGGSNGGSSTAQAPPPTEEETNLLKEILGSLSQSKELQQQFLPQLVNTVGFKYDANGQPVKMQFDEFLKSLDPTIRNQFENLQLVQESLGKALRGETGASPALERDISDKRKQLEEDLSRRLGPNWQMSTPGIQTMAQFDKDAELLREQSRQGIISNYSTINQNMADTLSQTPSGQLGMMSGIGKYLSSTAEQGSPVLNYFLNNRQMGLQANIARANLEDKENQALGSGIGQLGGSLFGDTKFGDSYLGKMFNSGSSSMGIPKTYFK